MIIIIIIIILDLHLWYIYVFVVNIENLEKDISTLLPVILLQHGTSMVIILCVLVLVIKKAHLFSSTSVRYYFIAISVFGVRVPCL